MLYFINFILLIVIRLLKEGSIIMSQVKYCEKKKDEMEKLRR